MYTDKDDIIKEIDELKKLERKLIRLNGNNKDAINKRFEAIERNERNITEMYNRDMLKLELKKIALYEIIDEINEEEKL